MTETALGQFARMQRFEATIPPHIARPPSGAELVGPLVTFRGQPVAVTSSPPLDTCDPRYAACTGHHLACACREAELGEELAEHRADRRELIKALETMLRGHPTLVYQHDGQPRPDLQCACQLCEFARVTHLVPLANNRGRLPRPYYAT